MFLRNVFKELGQKKAPATLNYAANAFSVLHQFYFDFYFDADESVT